MHPTTGECGIGDRSVGIQLCSPTGGCTGANIPAGYGAGLDVCHRADQVLGPFEYANPNVEGSILSINAATVSTSVADIEF
jgi:hypothetical protein